jgi:hypothetical protein
MDFAYLLRERDGSLRAEGDRHRRGLFPQTAWTELLASAGFVEGRAVDVHLGEPLGSRAFVARRG